MTEEEIQDTMPNSEGDDTEKRVDVETVDADVETVDADVETVDADVETVDAGAEIVDADVEIVDADVEIVDADVEIIDADVEQVGDSALLEDRLAQTEARLEEAEKLAAEYRDGWQRAQASFVNFRKRTESEYTQIQASANARLLSRIVPIMDDFKRAFDNVPETLQGNAWVEGIRMVERKLKSVLESENVKQIAVSSKDAFDPNFHQAVLYQEVDGFDDGEIVAEIETGYLLGDRVLRPSLVVVAKGREAGDVGDASTENDVEADQKMNGAADH
jgi:molecular chaperone GrpE